MKKLRRQLKMVKDFPAYRPNEKWVTDTRSFVMQKIIESSAPEVFVKKTVVERVLIALNSFVPRSLVVSARYGVALFLIAGVAIGGWIVSASASEESLPGEPLYGVKLAMEKTEVAVAEVMHSSAAVASKELDIAAKRVKDVKKSKSPEQKVAALQSLKKSVESANKRLEEATKVSNTEAVEVAKVVSEKTDRILESLENKTIPTVVVTDSQPSADSVPLASEASAAEKVIEDASVKAVKVLLENADSAEDVKDTVEKKLEKISTDLVVLNEAASTTVSQVAASTSTFSFVTSTVSSTSSTSSSTIYTSTSTLSVLPVNLGAEAVTASGTAGTPGVAVPVTPETVVPRIQQVLDRVGAAEVRVGEAKVLIEGNNLAGALQKVEEIYSLKNQVKETVNQITGVMQALNVKVPEVQTTPVLMPPVATTTVTTTSGTPLIKAAPIVPAPSPTPTPAAPGVAIR